MKTQSPAEEVPVAQAPRFSVEDEVSWTHVKQSGSRMDFSAREGRVVSVGPFISVVKMRNGRKAHVPNKDLRKKGELTGLTEMFMGLNTNEAKAP